MRLMITVTETFFPTSSRNAATALRPLQRARAQGRGLDLHESERRMRVSAKAQRACGERRPLDSGCLWGWLKARAEGHAVQARVPRQ